MVLELVFLPCFVPFFSVCFLGRWDLFLKLGNPRKWKKRREAERGVGLSFLIFILDGRDGLNLG